MDIKSRILQLCDRYGISVNELALRSCITQSTLNNITSGRNKTVTIKTIERVCEGFGITLAEFFEPTRWPDMPPEAFKEIYEFEKYLIKKYNLK